MRKSIKYRHAVFLVQILIAHELLLELERAEMQELLFIVSFVAELFGVFVPYISSNKNTFFKNQIQLYSTKLSFHCDRSSHTQIPYSKQKVIFY
jgi:hypothetical protein